jgi:hypothetical protein
MKRYEVTGTQPVLGDKMPGEKFDANMDEGQERFLLSIGAIKVISQDVAHDQRFAQNKAEESKAADEPKKKS